MTVEPYIGQAIGFGLALSLVAGIYVLCLIHTRARKKDQIDALRRCREYAERMEKFHANAKVWDETETNFTPPDGGA